MIRSFDLPVGWWRFQSQPWNLYAAQCDCGTVKIGLSAQTRRRMSQLRCPTCAVSRQTLTLLRQRRAYTFEEERQAHHRVRASLIWGNEWFRPSAEVMEFIERGMPVRGRPYATFDTDGHWSTYGSLEVAREHPEGHGAIPLRIVSVDRLGRLREQQVKEPAA